MAAYIIVVGTL